MHRDKAIDIATDVLKNFELTQEDLFDISKKLDDGFNGGLRDDESTFRYSPLKMIPTWLSTVPDGTERGKFVAIDIGGTNLRFFSVDLQDGKLIAYSTCHEISDEIINDQASVFFDFVAQRIHEGVSFLNLQDKKIKYFGLTFSFPVNQISLTSGLLIRWTKRFSVDGVVGKDICELLKKSCMERSLNIENFVLINDTTGTLMSGAYDHKNAVIGIINGTGTNACYIEKAHKVLKWVNEFNEDNIIINSEWGAFGEDGELNEYLTEYDKLVNSQSVYPGDHIFEKMISGMYLGEIARLVLIRLTKIGLLFDGIFPISLAEPYSLPTSFISDSYDRHNLEEHIQTFYKEEISEIEYEIILLVAEKISMRAARLTATGLYTMLKRIDCQKAVIACDGSMFRKHPRYLQYTKEELEKMMNEKSFKLVLAEDGSGRGAALAAAVASMTYEKKQTSIIT